MQLYYPVKISSLLRFCVKVTSVRQLSTLKVYNSLSKSKEPLQLKHDNNLLWYSCGPTVKS